MFTGGTIWLLTHGQVNDLTHFVTQIFLMSGVSYRRLVLFPDTLRLLWVCSEDMERHPFEPESVGECPSNEEPL